MRCISRGRNREKQKERGRFPAEHGAWHGPLSQDPEIMIWAEIKGLMLNQPTEPPRHPYLTSYETDKLLFFRSRCAIVWSPLKGMQFQFSISLHILYLPVLNSLRHKTKSESDKRKNNKLDFIKIKIWFQICTFKNTTKKVKWPATE